MQKEEQNKIIEPSIEKIVETQKKEFGKFQLEFTERVILFAIAGLGLITALAWDEAFKDLFKLIVGRMDDLESKFLYAFVLTILTTVVTILFGKFIRRKSSK